MKQMLQKELDSIGSGLLPGFGSGSSGGALLNVLEEEPFFSEK